MSIEDRFEEAAKRSQNLPHQSNENLLKIYALYKQATHGDVSGPKPGAFDFKGKAKYDAWGGQKGKTREAAMEEYITLIDSLGS